MSVKEMVIFYKIHCFINSFFYKVTDREKQLIRDSDRDTLAEWWLTLNVWKWPYQLLPEEKGKFIPGGRRSQLMKTIENKIGEWFILRKHNKDMTDQEFNDFWNGSRNGDEEAFKRYWARL